MEFVHYCLFTPAYSPISNAIEKIFIYLFSTTERKPLANGEAYTARLQKACDRITAEKCKGIIRHTKSFIAPSIALEGTARLNKSN